MSRPRYSPLVWLGLAMLIVAADQYTKSLIVTAFQLGEGVSVTAFFNLVRVHNLGAAFSFLADAGGWQRGFFTALGVVASAIMTWLLFRHAGQTLFSLALALVLGGAVGNVIDRIVYGAVADFLNMSCCGIENPFSFNVADVAIFLGAVGLVIWSGGGAPPPGRRRTRKSQ